MASARAGAAAARLARHRPARAVKTFRRMGALPDGRVSGLLREANGAKARLQRQRVRSGGIAKRRRPRNCQAPRPVLVSRAKLRGKKMQAEAVLHFTIPVKDLDRSEAF